MGKNSQATQQMTKGGVSGSGRSTTHDPAASSGNRGKYRGGATGTTRSTQMLNQRSAPGGPARDRDGDGF